VFPLANLHWRTLPELAGESVLIQECYFATLLEGYVTWVNYKRSNPQLSSTLSCTGWSVCVWTSRVGDTCKTPSRKWHLSSSYETWSRLIWDTELQNVDKLGYRRTLTLHIYTRFRLKSMLDPATTDVDLLYNRMFVEGGQGISSLFGTSRSYRDSRTRAFAYWDRFISRCHLPPNHYKMVDQLNTRSMKTDKIGGPRYDQCWCLMPIHPKLS